MKTKHTAKALTGAAFWAVFVGATITTKTIQDTLKGKF